MNKKYIGIVELSKNSENKEFCDWHIELWGTNCLIFGSACNAGLLVEGHKFIDLDARETVDNAMGDLLADLQVSIDQGEQYVSGGEFGTKFSHPDVSLVK